MKPKLYGQDLLEAGLEVGLDEYTQGAIEDTVARVLNLDRDERCVNELTEMVIRAYVDGRNNEEVTL